MGTANAAGDSPRVSRRSILYAGTAAMGAVGLVAAAWPFIDHLNPDAGTRASGDVIEADLTGLPPAQPRVLHWHGLPISVVRRTAAMVGSLRDERLLARMSDAKSEKRQQPAYAANWHRSIDPAVSVLVGVCTYCACVPQFIAEASPPDDAAGGYLCACCATHFDPAGRPHLGPAQYNLPVPPYEIVGARLVIGRNTSDVSFTLESVERM